MHLKESTLKEIIDLEISFWKPSSPKITYCLGPIVKTNFYFLEDRTQGSIKGKSKKL